KTTQVETSPEPATNGHTNVAHPGEFLWSEYLDPLDLTVTELAHGLRLSRTTVARILNGDQRISLDIAIRLGKAFDTPVEEWMVRQTAWDLANTDTTRITVERLMPEAADTPHPPELDAKGARLFERFQRFVQWRGFKRLRPLTVEELRTA